MSSSAARCSREHQTVPSVSTAATAGSGAKASAPCCPGRPAPTPDAVAAAVMGAGRALPRPLAAGLDCCEALSKASTAAAAAARLRGVRAERRRCSGRGKSTLSPATRCRMRSSISSSAARRCSSTRRSCRVVMRAGGRRRRHSVSVECCSPFSAAATGPWPSCPANFPWHPYPPPCTLHHQHPPARHPPPSTPPAPPTPPVAPLASAP